MVLLLMMLWALFAAEVGASGEGALGTGLGSGLGSGGSGDGSGGGAEGSGSGSGDGNAAQAGSPDAVGPATAQGTDPDELTQLVQLGPLGPAPVYGFETNPDPVVNAPPAAQARGNGAAPGSGSGKGADFMGSKAVGDSFVYIVDYSGSMGGGPGSRLVHAKTELQKSIDRLDSDVKFYVFVFESISKGMPAEGMVLATAANKRKFVDWAIHVPGGGSTNPVDALADALRMQPDAIFLMTDGGFDNPWAVHQALNTNWNNRTKVNTIAFHDRSAAIDLEDIATQTGGTYRFIPPP